MRWRLGLLLLLALLLMLLLLLLLAMLIELLLLSTLLVVSDRERSTIPVQTKNIKSRFRAARSSKKGVWSGRRRTQRDRHRRHNPPLARGS